MWNWIANLGKNTNKRSAAVASGSTFSWKNSKLNHSQIIAFIVSNLRLIRLTSRNIENSYEFYAGAISKIGHNVVGPGTQLKVNTPSEVVNKAVIRAWKRHSKAANFSASGCQNRRQMERQVVEGLDRDGEFFGIIHRDLSDGLIKIEPVDASRCPENLNTDTGKGPIIIAGIGFDRTTKKPVQYYFTQIELSGKF